MVTVHGTCPRCKGTGYALDLAPATLDDALIARVASYLSTGGLFNPELAQHDNVRDLLIDLRDRIAAMTAERDEWRSKATEWNDPLGSASIAYHQQQLAEERATKAEARADKYAHMLHPDVLADIDAALKDKP